MIFEEEEEITCFVDKASCFVHNIQYCAVYICLLFVVKEIILRIIRKFKKVIFYTVQQAGIARR